jgi:hypothetical protein
VPAPAAAWEASRPRRRKGKATIRFNTPIQGDLAYLASALVIEEVIGL